MLLKRFSPFIFRSIKYIARANLKSLALFSVVIFTLPVYADILISPQRAILTNNNPQATITLHNPGTIPRTYRLNWVERIITEEGELITLKDGENPRSIAAMVRYSPRRVIVQPGQTQTVRLNFRPPTTLQPGEYRSHLRIGQDATTDNDDSNTSSETQRDEKKGISFRVEALMSFAIPIFVRHGTGNATVKISAIEPVINKQDGRSQPGLNITLSREGEFSAY